MADKLAVEIPAGPGEVLPVINKRGRKPNGHKTVYQCDECLYVSDRNFNVERHRVRIHCKKINKECCGKKFRTKADWYYHVEDVHPNLREKSFVSKEKYQILGSKTSNKLLKYESFSCEFYASKSRTRVQKIYSCTPQKRTSLRIKNKLERKCLLMIREFNSTGSVGYDLDDLPLYYRLKYPQLQTRSLQSPEDYQLPPAESGPQMKLNPEKIDFPSDFTSNFHYSDVASLDFTGNYSDLVSGDGSDKSLDCSDDSGFNEALTVPEVDHEEVIEHKEAQEVNDSFFEEFKMQSVKQKNILLSQEENYRPDLEILPPKKRILKQWETNVISSVRHRKFKAKTNKRANENEENINPNREKDKGFKILVRQEKMSIWQQHQSTKEKEYKIVVMEEKSREIYCNAEERHRAFLDYFDFDRFKIL